MRWMRQLSCVVVSLMLLASAAIAERPAAQPAASYRLVRDVVYARADGRDLLMDLYVPRGASPKAKVPVVLYFHGGDWMYGTRRNVMGAFLVNYGLAVASVEYRLAPAFRFPSQAKDCRDALVFIKNSGERYGLDTQKVGALGESAGGHLAALLTTTPDEKQFDGVNKPKEAARVQAVCSVSGPMDVAMLGAMADLLEGAIGKNPIQFLLGGKVSDKLALAQLASPLEHVAAGLPPFLIVLGDRDFVVPPLQGRQMHEALVKAHVESEIYEISGMGHDMPAIFDDRTREVIGGFFQKRLLGYPTTRPAR